MARLDIGWALRPMLGQRECGDLVVEIEHANTTLLAVIDGVGHGPRAAAAAKLCARTLRANAGLALEPLFWACDAALEHAEGVAMTALRIDRHSLQFEHAGVGDVELRGLIVEPIHAIPQPGIIGARMRKVVVSAHRLHPGDLIILHTDGVSRRLQLELMRRDCAQATAEAILRTHAKAHDDACCAVVHVDAHARAEDPR